MAGAPRSEVRTPPIRWNSRRTRQLRSWAMPASGLQRRRHTCTVRIRRTGMTDWCLAGMGFYEVDVERAITLLEEALRLFRALGDGWGISHALRRLGWELIGKRDLERAEILLQEALLLARNARNKHATAWSL